MQHINFTITTASGQPRKPRNQAEFRSLYIADLERAAEANGITLTDVPELPIRHATSRTGRKALQKAFDAACRRLRREAGVPARSGPPIPGSERTGQRRWYTLEEMSRRGSRSGMVRKFAAMPRWVKVQTLHYRRLTLRAIARQVGLSLTQVQRIVAGRRWRKDGEPRRSPQGVVVNSVRGTPHTWARALALNDLYLGQCWAGTQAHKRMVTRREKYLRGITKHRGAEAAATVVAATETYVKSLAHLDVQLAVAQVNLDSGYKVLQR